MKIVANDYEPKIVLKFMREWTEKTQDAFGSDLGLAGMTIQGYERGTRQCSFNTFMAIADTYGLTVTIEKKK